MTIFLYSNPIKYERGKEEERGEIERERKRRNILTAKFDRQFERYIAAASAITWVHR